jgi:8-oxo-dGTP pyrophosphatase MutT (NUDIX family)
VHLKPSLWRSWSGGTVLLVRRRSDDDAPPWVLPGGSIKSGESAEDAAVRETLEETRLTVAARHLLGSRVHPASRCELHYVACDLIAGTARVVNADEIEAVEWVPIGISRSHTMAPELPGDTITTGFCAGSSRPVLLAEGGAGALRGHHPVAHEKPGALVAPGSGWLSNNAI